MGICGLALLLGHAVQAQTILSSVGSKAVMAGSTLTINGTAFGTVITGGLAAAGTIAGSQASAYTFNGETGPGTPGAMTVDNQNDFTKVFDGLAALTPTTTLDSQNLGGQTLLPGIYSFGGAAVTLTGTLTLDANHQSNAVWVFQIGSSFVTTAANATVTFANLTANSEATNGLFWRIGTDTTIGAGTTLEGNLLGGGSFSVGTGATLNHGRLLAGTAGGTITLSDNTIDFIAADSGYAGGLAFDSEGDLVAAVPEPSTYALLAGAVALMGAIIIRRLRTLKAHTS